MGQGALSKPVVQWWLSLNSSTTRPRLRWSPPHGDIIPPAADIATTTVRNKFDGGLKKYVAMKPPRQSGGVGRPPHGYVFAPQHTPTTAFATTSRR